MFQLKKEKLNTADWLAGVCIWALSKNEIQNGNVRFEGFSKTQIPHGGSYFFEARLYNFEKNKQQQ